MPTDIQVDDGGGNWRDIDNGEWEIKNGVSDVMIAPTANVRTHVDEDIDANQSLRIQIDGTTRFEGRTTSSGRFEFGGGRRIKVEHRAYDMFEEEVDLDVSNPTTEEVLDAALLSTALGGNFTLSYAGSPVSLSDDYVVENRPVKRVFKDMTDRTSRIWWVDSDDVIHFQPHSGRGAWATLDFPGSDGGVIQYDPGEISTVRNHVVVNGTRDEHVVGTATESTSISEYGRRSMSTNVEYITTEAEADEMAQELLIPEPLAEAEIQIGTSVGGGPEQNLSNYAVTLSDESKGISNENLVIEEQTIEQGKVTLKLGEGSGVSMENINRDSKSTDDNSEPGSVMGEERIADESIVEQKLAQLSVSIDHIQDEAVAEAKVRQSAITETKIQDNSITTPKVNAGAITAGEIDAAAVEAIHISADAVEAGKIAADAVGATEIIANSITATEIDVLNLTTADFEITGSNVGTSIVFEETTGGIDELLIRPDGSANFRIGTNSDPVAEIRSLGVEPPSDFQGQVGGPDRAYASMTAYDFIDASDGSSLTDGGEPLEGLASMDAPPEFLKSRGGGLRMNKLSRWLFDIATAQQGRIESLEDRIDRLEDTIINSITDVDD